jgi:SprT protein
MSDKHPETAPEQCAERTARQAEQRAREFYRLALPEATIDFSLRGRCAAQARVDRKGGTWLRLNKQLLAENLDDFLINTIPHEVAHLVVNWQVYKKRQRPKPHGAEWQKVMQDCYGLKPVRCHSYETTPARIVTRPFLYTCNCQEHRLTSIMHNRISKAGGALCKRCKALLHLSTQTK